MVRRLAEQTYTTTLYMTFRGRNAYSNAVCYALPRTTSPRVRARLDDESHIGRGTPWNMTNHE